MEIKNPILVICVALGFFFLSFVLGVKAGIDSRKPTDQFNERQLVRKGFEQGFGFCDVYYGMMIKNTIKVDTFNKETGAGMYSRELNERMEGVVDIAMHQYNAGEMKKDTIVKFIFSGSLR
jgi:hypothetical protein